MQTATVRKHYTTDDVQKAIDAVKCGSHSLRQAEKDYGVPRATIDRKMKGGPLDQQTNSPGIIPYLNLEEESSIAVWAIECSKRGQPRTPLDIRFAAKRILENVPRKTPFTHNIPSHHWYRDFQKRNPIVKSRKPEALSSASANVSEGDLRKWWFNIDLYLKENGYINIVQDASRIFNTDESMFLFNPKPVKVLVERTSKTSYMSQRGGNKTGVTVLHTVSNFYLSSNQIFLIKYMFNYNRFRQMDLTLNHL